MAKASVLIVDDRKANLLSLEELLSTYKDEDGEGIETTQAMTGEDALRILLTKKFDLILLDVQMPKMDGYQVAQIIGMNQRTRSIPIIFLSAVYGDDFHVHRGYQGGAIDFILKPVNPDVLKSKVGNFLKIQRAIRKAAEAEKEKEALVEAARLKSQFLMNMNHELRTPMNGVLGMLNLLVQTTKLDATQQEYTETIRKSGSQMLQIIDSILDVARLEAKQMELICEPVDLKTLIEEVSALYQFECRSKKIQLEVLAVPHDVRPVLCDSGRLRQAVMNLISNAVKFTEKGKVSIHLRVLAMGEEMVTAEIDVSDTGVGIAQENQANLFELFSQGDSSSTKKYGGTGLGLITTKRLIELMNGTVRWSSVAGNGSLFQLVIPFRLAQTKAVEEPIFASDEKVSLLPSATPSASEGTILVVDDNPVNRTVAARMVCVLGYQCDIACDGSEAVHCFNNKPYDAILMDCLMPEMDGWEATRAIRENAKRYVPIVGISANSEPDDIEKCKAAGMDGFIGKPIDLETLRALLKAVQGPKSEKDFISHAPGARKTASAIDEKVLRSLRSLSNEKHSILNGLIDTYQTTTPKIVDRIGIAIASKDLERAALESSALKMIAKEIGATAVWETVEKMELAFKQNSIALIRELFLRLDQENQRAIGELARPAA